MRVAFNMTSIVLAFSFFITPFAPLAYAQEAPSDAISSEGTPELVSTPTEPTISADPTAPERDVQTISIPELEPAVIGETPAPQPETGIPEAPADGVIDANQKPVDESVEATAPETPSALSGGSDGSTPQYDVTTARSSFSPQVDQQSGSLTYSVPIDPIPGRNGLTPELSLNYSSQDYAKNGIIGYGWSVSIPYIERINRRGTDKLYTDNYFISSIDGELVKVSATEYVPKTQEASFRKYELVSNVWVVTEKDGTKYTFGSSTSSRLDDPGNSSHVFRWMISDIRDLNNDFVRYAYTKDSGQIYPDSIFYTGTGTTDGPFSIVFVKELRNDTRASYATGFKVETKYRVNEVRAEDTGVWAKKYALGYTAGSNGTSSLLSTITVSGKDKDGTVTTLPDTSFTYQTASSTWTQDTAWNIPEWFVNDGLDQGVRFADYNGDGLTDIVRSYDENEIVIASTTYRNTGSGWATDTRMIPQPLSHEGRDSGTRLLDVDGDGLPDMVRATQGFITFDHGYRNTTMLWDTATTSVTDNFFAYFSADRGFRFGDINGDGLVDILHSCYEYSSKPFRTCNLLTPDDVRKAYTNNGIGTSPHAWSENSTWSSIPVQFVIAHNDNGVRVLDINGDGLTDLIHAGQVYLNTGAGWSADASWAPPVTTLPSPDNGVRYADVDGDNLPDILQYQEGSSTNKIYLNTGSGWVYQPSWSVPLPLAASSSGTFVDSGTYIDDVDGDGLVDFVRSYKSGTTTEIKQVWRKDGLKANVLKEITVSSGGKSTIEYAPSTSLLEPNGSLKNPILPLVFDVVATTTEYASSGTSMRNTYSYGGGSIYYNNPLDRQFAGFATTTVVDGLGNKTITNYHQGNGSQTALGEYQDHVSKIGRPYRTEVYDASSNLYQTTVNRWDKYALNATSTFVKLATSTTLTYDGDGDHRDTAIDYAYDNTYGNLTKKTEYGEVTASIDGTFTDSGTDKRTTDLTYIASTSPYIVGLPKQESLKNNAGTTIADTKYYYDTLAHGSVNKGNLTKTEQWVIGSTWIDTEKSYNSYGLVTQEKDPRDKTTTYTYDSYNLYPATTTNPLGQTTYREYDYSSGKVTKLKDPNGLTYETVYDGLDRVTTEKQPDLTTPSTLVTKTAYEYTNTKAETKVKQSDYLDASTIVDTYQYFDGLGRPIQSRREAETANTFVTTDRVYNERGELKRESLPYFSTGSASTTATTNGNLLSTYTYDTLGRPKTIANAVGTTTYAYDQWETVVTDANGKPKDLHHDGFNRLSTVEEHNGASTYTTTYEYDSQNSLTKVTDTLSNIRNFTYDGLGRRTKAEDLHASGDSTFGKWLYAYDQAGNVSSSTNPNGQATNYTYDDLERPLTEDYLGGSGTEILYAYDICTNGKGKLCTATSTGATTKYQYNALGALSQDTKTVKNVNYTTAYDYTRRGDPTKVIYPDNSEVTYEYDGSGRLETVRRKESTDPGYSTIARYLTYTPIDTLEYYEYGDTSYTYSEYDPDEVYRLRYRASIANDTGTNGSGMPTYLGGEADAEVPANLARMRTTVPQLLRANTTQKVRYTSRTLDDNLQPSILPITRIAYDTTATPRRVSKEEQAFYEAGRKAHPVRNYVPQPHRMAPAKSFEVDNASALRNISPDGSTAYLLSSVNPPRASQRMKTEGLWLTNTITENRSFESDTSHWDYWADAGSTVARDCTTAGEGSCSFKAYNAGAGNEWDVALLQELRIEPNVTYKLTFRAKASATTSFMAIVGQNYSPWYDYGLSRSVTVGPTWQTYTYTFRSAASSSDERADVYFGFGTNQGTFYVDDVRLIPDDLTTVRNPSFENGSIDEWYFGGTGASYTVPCTGAPDGVCAMQATLTQAGQYWTVEFSLDTLSVASGTSYLLSFDAKAGASRNIYVELGQAHTPWNLLAPTVTVPLTNTWTHYETTLTSNASDANARIGFYLGNSTASVSLDNIRFREAVPTKVTDMTPEFSGIYDDPDVPDTATNYQIQVDNSWGDFSDPLYDSGKTSMTSTSEGNRIADKSYAGPSLYTDGTKYKWRIKLWDNSDNEGAFTNGEDYFYTAGDQVQQTIYAYDRNGNVTQILDDNSVGTDKNYVYAYDDLNRLTTMSQADDYPQYVNGRLTADAPVSTIESYAYSSIGNITNKSDLGSYTYAGTGYANPHAVTTVNGQTYTYDNNGNVTADGIRTNTWNYRNELNQTVKAGTTYRYTYDHGGQRTAYYDGSATTTYPNKYYDQKGNTVTKHLYLPNGTLIGSVEGTSTAAQLRYVYTDHLGGTKGVTRDGGARSQMLDYMPFGATRIDAQYESSNESKKFTGHEHDGETGLYYMNARYQNPSTGRFVSQDPAFWALPAVLLANPQKQNSYTYADNNPISMVDPTGEAALSSSQTASLASAIASGKIVDIKGVTKMLLSYAAGKAKAGVDKVVTTTKNTARSINEARPAVGVAIGDAVERPLQGILTIIDPSSTIAERIGAAFGVGLSVYPGKGGGMVPRSSGFAGKRGFELKNYPSGGPPRNMPTIINGRPYSGHAIDQMQDRGLYPEVIENTIRTGTTFSARDGAVGYHDPTNDVTVFTNPDTGNIITVRYGDI
jgi:RHS repeat-associated protein